MLKRKIEKMSDVDVIEVFAFYIFHESNLYTNLKHVKISSNLMKSIKFPLSPP